MINELILSILYALTSSPVTNANTLNCTSDNPCKDDEYSCSPNEDCYIYCLTDSICDLSTFNCPNDYDCHVFANGYRPLYVSNIVGANNGNLFVNIIGGEQTCMGTAITCPSYADCNITASNASSALYLSDITATSTTNLLYINAIESHRVLMQAEIVCPQQRISGSQNNCIITLYGSTETTVNEMLYEAQIFAIESFTDLSLTCNYITDATKECFGSFRYPSMICGTWETNDAFPHDWCYMQLAEGTYSNWSCSDGQKDRVCEGYTFAPTTSPTLSPSSAPTQPPSIAPTFTPSNAPSNNPTTPPSSAPSMSPTKPPSHAPSFSPSTAPTNNPTMSPTQTPTQPPTNDPSSAPTSSPSDAPSVSPTDAPTRNPTPYPTYYNVSNHENIVSNYVMNSNFGFDDFRFPAAIGQCMNEYFESDTYVMYQCIDQDTAMSTIYETDQCDPQSIISTHDLNSDVNEFVCDGNNDTFIQFGLYPSEQCAQSQSTKIFIADGVCTSFVNGYYKLFTNGYQSEVDDKMYTELWFQYFNDQCSIYGFEEEYVIDPCTNKATNHLSLKSVYINVIDSFMVNNDMDDEGDMNDEGDMDDVLSGYDITGYAVVAFVVFVPILFIMIALLFHRKKEGTDDPAYISLFTFFSSIGDFYTDLLWALTLYSQSNYLYIYAFIFTFGPHILSTVICLVFITKWRQNKKQLHIAEFATRFDKIMITASLFSGFYATIDMMTSHLFHLELLSFQLKHSQKLLISNLKIINIVILENMPCAVIQLIHLNALGTALIVNNGLNITLLALGFSILSIAFGVLTVGIRLFNEYIENKNTQKDDNNMEQNKISLLFTLKSSESTVFEEHHIHSHKLLSKAISRALHLQRSQIDIIFIQKITNGIKIEAELFIYLNQQNPNTILTELNDKECELYGNLYKECKDRLQILSKHVSLDILKLCNTDSDKSVEMEKLSNNESKGKTTDAIAIH